MKIASGFCQCGCGERTTIITQTISAHSRFKGQPNRFALGHKPARKWFRLDKKTGCHIWLGAKQGGGRYGVKRWKSQSVPAHRFYWERKNGPLPKNTELNHICRNTLCINPDHLEALSHQMNVQVGRRAKLSPKDVQEIRRLYHPGHPKLFRLLCVTFKVSRYTIWSIVKRKTWANV